MDVNDGRSHPGTGLFSHRTEQYEIKLHIQFCTAAVTVMQTHFPVCLGPSTKPSPLLFALEKSRIPSEEYLGFAYMSPFTGPGPALYPSLLSADNLLSRFSAAV